MKTQPEMKAFNPIEITDRRSWMLKAEMETPFAELGYAQEIEARPTPAVRRQFLRTAEDVFLEQLVGFINKRLRHRHKKRILSWIKAK